MRRGHAVVGAGASGLSGVTRDACACVASKKYGNHIDSYNKKLLGKTDSRAKIVN